MSLNRIELLATGRVPPLRHSCNAAFFPRAFIRKHHASVELATRYSEWSEEIAKGQTLLGRASVGQLCNFM
eukprot:8764710-Pyramimonas_sp.AAC.1